MKSHKVLIVYHLPMLYVIAIYGLSAVFSESEKFGLTSQLRRAVVSVPSNIAEGAARQSRNEFV